MVPQDPQLFFFPLSFLCSLLHAFLQTASYTDNTKMTLIQNTRIVCVIAKMTFCMYDYEAPMSIIAPYLIQVSLFLTFQIDERILALWTCGYQQESFDYMTSECQDCMFCKHQNVNKLLLSSIRKFVFEGSMRNDAFTLYMYRTHFATHPGKEMCLLKNLPFCHLVVLCHILNSLPLIVFCFFFFWVFSSLLTL